MTFAEATRSAVTRAGSVAKLAAELGVSPRTVRYWLSGKLPSAAQQRDLRRYLGEASA